jgi:hypothetical protein
VAVSRPPYIVRARSPGIRSGRKKKAGAILLRTGPRRPRHARSVPRHCPP